MLAPLGAQEELICRVTKGNNNFITWTVRLPGKNPANTHELGVISALSLRGIKTEVSSAENREPALTINGTVENNQTTAQCIAVINNFFERCDGDVVTMTFYGKTSLIGGLSIIHCN